MSHFSYCQKCGEGLFAPTAREDLIDGKFCSNGHRQDQRYTLEEWIVILYDNIQDLK